MTTLSNLLTLSELFPELAAQELPNGRVKITLADKSCPIWLEYYHVSNAQSGDDAWRYQYSHTTAKTESAGPFSHPAEQGCWIQAKKYFIANDYIEIPDDNSHLSAATAQIVAEGQLRRDARAASRWPTPETGDFIVDQAGTFRRVCNTSDTSCQQTTALQRSYWTSNTGGACYSGSLGASVPYDRLTKNTAKQPALFWTFRDGQSGAGRGVDLWMNVTVWSFDGTFGDGLWEVS